eukprot:15100115-Alexandrium_andersonii.AAC.1
MSASLVGSEMCIRDRYNPSATRMHMKLGLRPWEASEPIGNVLCSMEPVSYTHLTLPTICSV